MTKLFGSSGIRGIYGEKITPGMALSVGTALGTYLKQGKVLIARDARATSEILENALASGLESTGVETIRTGLAPTPALAFATKKLGMNAGVIITASHNPPEYNGMKFWQGDSSAYSKEMEEELEKLVNGAAGQSESGASWENIHSSTSIDIISDYSKAITGFVELKNKHKIALDCGNGAACAVSPGLLSQFGEVSKIFSTAEGAKPGRKSEPSEENLSELKKLVVETNSEIGIAHDGDSDRLAIVDEKGNFVKKDKLLAILAIHELEKESGNIVIPVDTSRLVEEAILNAGGQVSMTKIGDVFVAQEMRNTDAVFGGEPSGCFIFPKANWCPDAVLASLKVLEILEKSQKSMSELTAELGNYVTLRKKVECSDENKEKMCNELYEKVRTMEGSERIIEIDGVRADFKDAWVLVRPSGTEPIVRITVEAETAERADELMKKLF
tara:strand:+ start:258 stop:1586 length:1329 start_codon:yes stop_codon:yes gene_type:complete